MSISQHVIEWDEVDRTAVMMRPATPSVDRSRAATHAFDEVELIVGSDGQIEEVSTSARHVLGYDPKRLVGTPLFRHIYEKDMLSVFRSISDLVNGTSEEASLELRMRTSKGDWCPCRAEVRAVFERSALFGVLLVLHPVLTAVAL